MRDRTSEWRSEVINHIREQLHKVWMQIFTLALDFQEHKPQSSEIKANPCSLQFTICTHKAAYTNVKILNMRTGVQVVREYGKRIQPKPA